MFWDVLCWDIQVDITANYSEHSTKVDVSDAEAKPRCQVAPSKQKASFSYCSGLNWNAKAVKQRTGASC